MKRILIALALAILLASPALAAMTYRSATSVVQVDQGVADPATGETDSTTTITGSQGLEFLWPDLAIPMGFSVGAIALPDLVVDPDGLIVKDNEWPRPAPFAAFQIGGDVLQGGIGVMYDVRLKRELSDASPWGLVLQGTFALGKK